MPRGRKSKLRAREKRQHDRAQDQGLTDAQAVTAEEEEATSSPSPDGWDGMSTSAVPGTLLAPVCVPANTSAAAGVSSKSSGGGARSRGKKNKNSSWASTFTLARPGEDLLAKKAGMLVQFLLYKYKMNEPTRKADMLKIVHKSFRQKFPEILEKASVNLDVIYGLELKEVGPNSHSYTLVFNSDDTSNGSLSWAWQFPTKGILMPLLGVIFLHHGRAPEEQIWEILKKWGIYEGRSHFLFGEPKKLITQDLVKEKYLEYRQVPGSDPPRFEFLWGSRAHAETSKMKVLEFLSKINGNAPSDFPCCYQEALRDEEARARATAATVVGTTAKSSGE